MTSAATELHPTPISKQRGAKAKQPPPRIVIQYPTPAVDGGRYPTKRCVGDTVTVEADIFRDGHDLLRAVVRYKGPDDSDHQESEMRRIDAHLGGVRWAGSFDVDRQGTWEYTVETWTDVFGTWRDELERKVAAQQHDLAGELSEGVLLLEAAKKAATENEDKALLEYATTTLAGTDIPESARHDVALGPELFATVERIQPRAGSVTLPEPITIEVDRLRARFSSWYELFPRSWGGLKGVESQLTKLAGLGFDIVYLPPIHPIGLTNRKGANNSLTAGPNDPGSPWAIGDQTGGHDAVHPELGTIEDLKALTDSRKKARHRDRARLRDPELGRPPLAARAPRVVPPPPGRDAQIRREPA